MTPPPRGGHVAIHGADHDQCSVHVHLHEPLVIRIVDRQQTFAPHARENRGIVDEIVDPTEGAFGLYREICGRLRGGHVSADEQCATAGRLDVGGHAPAALLIDFRDHHCSALPAERLGVRLPDSLARPGDAPLTTATFPASGTAFIRSDPRG
jgi:hypothetical protein